jgi:hypothetical protein
MNEFPPPRQRGLVIHIIIIIALGAISLGMFWLVFRTPVGLLFTVYILVALATFIPLPILAYRAYALTRGNYLLDRNNLRLVWGLRVEEIPVANVEWVRPIQTLPVPLTLPWLRLPGGLVGVTHHADIGNVEFLASETDTLLLVATARRVFAISPAEPAAFIAAFQRAIEMGSLSRIEAHSQYPSFIVSVAWESMVVRYLWLVGAFLNAGLLVWVTVLAPGIQRIPLGFTPAGTPQEAVPGAQLILLPLLSALFFIISWLAGLFFYRRLEQRTLALSLWASNVICAFFFLLAVFFLVTTPI